MRPLPQDLAAPAALPEVVQPGVSPRRHSTGCSLLRNFHQRASAGHAAGIEQGQLKLLEHVAKLLGRTRLTRNEQGGLPAVPDHGKIENPGVAGEKDAPFLAGNSDELAVIDAQLPGCIVTGGAEPACQASQHRVTSEGQWACQARLLRESPTFQRLTRYPVTYRSSSQGEFMAHPESPVVHWEVAAHGPFRARRSRAGRSQGSKW